MGKYVDKDALVSELKKKIEYAQTLGDNAVNTSMQQFYDGMKEGCNNLLKFLDTLETKEVDFEKESEYPFKKGDKVIIHCRAERHQDNVIFELFDNKMGTVQDIWELKRNPWGNIGVIINGGYSDMFYVDELEPVPKGE